MRTLDLFAGIGGFALAGQWMGWETAAFVEWDPFCQKVLAKNFSDVPIYGDINQFSYEQEKERIGTIDLVCGGFPCQPFSTAGKRNGRDDDRYLWPEMLRVIREVQPTWVVGENVAGLLTMDGGAVFEEVCASLENEGYTVQAFVLPAIAKGAPHRRDRVWIVANRTSEGLSKPGQPGERQLQTEDGRGLHDRFEQPDSDAVTNAERIRQSRQGIYGHTCNASPCRKREADRTIRHSFQSEHWYEVATRFCRMDDGLPSELDKLRNSNRTNRLKALGNAIVPQVVYEIFQAIQKQTQ